MRQTNFSDSMTHGPRMKSGSPPPSLQLPICNGFAFAIPRTLSPVAFGELLPAFFLRRRRRGGSGGRSFRFRRRARRAGGVQAFLLRRLHEGHLKAADDPVQHLEFLFGEVAPRFLADHAELVD